MANRTSYLQFNIIVDFMGKNGDLSKPTGGPRGRQWCNMKWRELTEKLNSEGDGKTASEEKWRKAWSDYKNNIKRKWAKVKRSMHVTGGGPALKMCLTDLEQRVLAIMGEEAATGMLNVHEIGFGEVEIAAFAGIALDTDVYIIGNEEWNIPGTSQDPVREPHSPILCARAARPLESLTPPTPPPARQDSTTPRNTPPRTSQPTQQQKKRMITVEDVFVRMESNARQDNRERDRMYIEVEREKICLREGELQARQDEIALRAQFLDLLFGTV